MNASLKTVVLEGDLVGDATGLAVAGALKSNRTLINLAVHGDLVGNETGLAMAGVLLENRTLASLKLEGATLGDPTNQAFAEVLCAPASQLWSLKCPVGASVTRQGEPLRKFWRSRALCNPSPSVLAALQDWLRAGVARSPPWFKLQPWSRLR